VGEIERHPDRLDLTDAAADIVRSVVPLVASRKKAIASHSENTSVVINHGVPSSVNGRYCPTPPTIAVPGARKRSLEA
jgi:hypothetical protein